MFEVPDVKRVRRGELYDDDQESNVASQDGEVKNDMRDKLQAQLASLLDLEFSTASDKTAALRSHSPEIVEDTDAAPVSLDEGRADDGELAFEFRLFRDEPRDHTVVLDARGDQAEATGEGAFVVPRRPMSYYLAEAPDQNTMESYSFAAVTADGILADSKRRRCWGLEKPWRVMHISVSSKPALSPSQDHGRHSDEVIKRRRPGKKRRIILRTREKAIKAKEEAARNHATTKEEHLKEKKKRLNREKKLKRRAKEKEKKVGPKATSEKEDASDDEGLEP